VKKAANLPGEASTIKQKVSSYELAWEDLEAYLRRRFKDYPSLDLVEDVGELFLYPVGRYLVYSTRRIWHHASSNTDTK